MLNRLIVALIGIPILMFLYYSGGLYLLLFTNVIIGIGLHEFYKMSENIGVHPYKNLGLIMGLLLPNFMYFINDSIVGVFVVILTLVMSLSMKVFKSKIEDASRDIGMTLLGVVYVSLMFSHIILISKLDQGWKWIIGIQIMVWLCDSMAYFVGMNFGRKFFKEGFSVISPKKSKEGFLGGCFFTVIGIYLLNLKLNLSPNTGLVLLLGLLVSIVAPIGDLAESLFKREFKIKDSSRILGEHGGILDRFDSMIFVLPTVYYILRLF